MRADTTGSHDFEETGAISLERAFIAVRRRWKLIAGLPLLAVAIMALAVSTLPDRYGAVSVIQIDPRQKSITSLESVLPDLTGDQSSIESEVEIIKSRPIVLQVIERLQLRTDPEFTAPGLIDRIWQAIGGATNDAGGLPARDSAVVADPISAALEASEPGTYVPSRDVVARAVNDRMTVVRVRNTLLIEIRFTASDPMKAARIANTIAEIYLKDQLDAKNGAAQTASRLLEKRITELRGRVSLAERKVAEWKALNGVFDSDGNLLSEKQLTRLMEQTVFARNATSEARAKFDQAQGLLRRGRDAANVIDVLNNGTVQALKESLSAAERRASESATRYGPLHPEMKKIQADVREARAQLDNEVRKVVANLKNEVEVAERRERQLAQSLSHIKEQEIVRTGQSAELSELEREASASKALYETLLARYKQTNETQGFQLPDARIIEKADVPLHPAGPKRKQLVILAAVIALGGALGLALLLEIATGGLNRPEDVEDVLSLSHLASLPKTAHGAGATGASIDVRRVVAEPTSRYAEAIRASCRTLDRFERRDGRIVLVISAMPGEGAELFASNLAHHYAVSGRAPLLVDADFRLQPLTRKLAPQRMRGLLDQIGTNDVVEAAILRDTVTGLNFLPAASAAPQQVPVSAAITSGRLIEVFAGLRSRFGTVIVSAPPVLPVLDARILADYADQIILVVGCQKTPRQLVKKAIARLGFNAEKLIGAVLTDVDPNAMDGEELMQTLISASATSTGADHYRNRAA